MRRAIVLVVIAGCGRFNFEGLVDANDGSRLPDGMPDGATDGAAMIDGAVAVDGTTAIDAVTTCTTTPATCANLDLGTMVGSNVATGTTAGAGDDFTNTCGGGGLPDVALQWTAPVAGRFTFDTHDSSFDTVLAVRPDCSGAELACNNDDPVGGTSSALTLDLVACQSLVFIVDGTVGEGNFDFSARLKCPGPDLGGALGTIATGATNGTVDSYQSTCGGEHEPDVAWDWTAPSTGRYVFDTRGSSFDTVLAIQDTCTGAVTACNNDDPVGGDTSAITKDLTSGQALVLIVDGFVGAGNYKLNANLKCPGIPAGSMLGTIATGNTSTTGDSYLSDCGGSGQPDVVVNWTAPTTGRYVFDTRGSMFDTVLAIHDTCTGPTTTCNNDDPVGGTTSALSVDMTAGQSIALVVDGHVGGGNFQLDANRKCPGIDLGSALGTAIATGDTSVTGDSYKSGCGGSGEPDVAFTWTAPASGHYHIDTMGSTFDTVLAIQDTCTGPVTACNNDDPAGGTTSAVDLTLIAGQVIVIVIDGAVGGGAFQLDITGS